MNNNNLKLKFPIEWGIISMEFRIPRDERAFIKAHGNATTMKIPLVEAIE